jgi:hypothetical protein
MSSIEENITHDHIYLANSDIDKDCNQAKHSDIFDEEH